eukprot:TRINITY_DN657_c0_g4_i5.p1 TRINITY_DN657_c0_g4~~TRINITY_DN657_c0_g4_i5.p1  ORF type:complete len:257 (-),score=78.70 TRINITY_DN657_c0_g4_i5:90-860(-)
MIAVDNFRGHVLSGVTLTGKNWFGSIYRPDADCYDAGAWCPMSLHNWVDVQVMPMGAYNPLVDLLGHRDLGAKCVVFLMDGLYGGDTQDSLPPVHFLSSPFDNWWSCSLMASQDPVALDSVAYDFLRNEPNVPYAHEGCIDNYMHEAALAADSPSKTGYNPTGTTPLASLGCHEHWDAAKTKRYSRNLDKAAPGIELVAIKRGGGGGGGGGGWAVLGVILGLVVLAVVAIVIVVVWWRRRPRQSGSHELLPSGTDG